MAVTFPQLMQRLAPVGGPLAGRERELDVLRRAWIDAQDGACRLVLVAGEAGVGKTRLVAELAGEVESAGGDVVVGTCPAGGAEPYHPLVEALGPVPVGHGDRDAAFRELAASAAARARRTPMLLVLDDLHRTDRSTVLAVRHIVEVEPCPLLVVATYRDATVDRSHPLSEFLAAVLTRPGVERIALEGLGPEALIDLVGDAEVARRVWRQSEGNPVRVRELVRLGALDRPLPPSFDELIARRTAGLSVAARRLLEAAAVVGSEFSVPAAAAAAQVPADRVPLALKQLAAAGFVVDEPAGPGETRRFVHDMVREAIADRLEPLARVRLHLRVGQALERLDPRTAAPAALLAWHFRAAAPVGGSLPALGHSTAAAERAMEVMAWEEAAVHYGYALAAATGASADVRTDLLLSLGEAQRRAGETARARQAFLEAAKVARTCEDGARLARAALALGQVAAAWGADPELEELAGEARSLLGHAGDAGPVAPVFSPETDFASDVLYDVLDGVNRQPAQPVATARSTVDPAAAAVLRARHVALAGPEHAPDRLATAEELVTLADELGDDDLATTGWGWGLVAAMELGRLEQAAVHQAAHRELAVRLGDPRPSADVAAWVAMRATLEGRVDDAAAAADNAFAFASEAGDPEADESYLLQRWWLALEWGSPDKLTQVAGECRARASAAAGGRTWRAAAALALARAGRLDQAAEELREATDHGLGELIRDPGRLHPLSCLAEVAWLLGDGYRAATVGPLLEPFADQMIVAGRGRAWRGSVARACGLVAASAYRWDEAEDHFEAALTAHRRTGALPLLARTRFEWSRLLAERGSKGDKRKAADFRRKSADLATRLGMTRLLEELNRPAP